jgi:hypothetical protein
MNPLPDVVAESNAKALTGGQRYDVQFARDGLRYATAYCAGESAPFALQDRQVVGNCNRSFSRSGIPLTQCSRNAKKKKEEVVWFLPEAGGTKCNCALRVRHAMGCCADGTAPFVPQDKQTVVNCVDHSTGG